MTPVLKWSLHTGICKEYDLIEGGLKTNNFLTGRYCNDHVWFLPKTTGYAYKINTHTDLITVAEELDIADEATHTVNGYLSACTFSGSLYAFKEKTGSLVEYNFAKNERSEDKISYSSALMPVLSKLYVYAFISVPKTSSIANEQYYNEDSEMLLSNYITYIAENFCEKESVDINCRAKNIKTITANSDGKCGQKIYEDVKKRIFNVKGVC